MKYVVVTITRETEPGRPAMKYPAIYIATDVDRNRRGPLVYNQGLSKGGDEEEMMMFVADGFADEYATDPGVEILDEAEADTWLLAVDRVQNAPEEVVTDVDRMLLIIAKNTSTPRIQLSDEDKRALDPDDKMKGVNKKSKKAKNIFSGDE